ncbi:MAG: SdrD B-like domain-containing protein [Desulfobulbaceae bacterium]
MTNDPDNEFWALDELLYDPGFTIGILSLNDGDCVNAVSILDQRDIDSGKKKSSDSAYTLAMHLFAYELNQAAGACQSYAADQAAAAAQQLLFSYDFDGTGSYLRPKGQTYDDYYYALDLKDILDNYNNGLLCENGSGEPPQDEGTVSGHIYEDTNGDGTQDAGEPGLAGVVVEITDSLAGTRTVTTDGNGDYSATVPAGSTTVDVDEATLPTGLDPVPTDGTDSTTINVIAGINNYIGVVGYKPSSQKTDTVHIGSLEGEFVPGSKGKLNAEVTVTVHDGNENTLAGVTVSGSWSGGAKGSDTCVTDGLGQCTITKSNIRGDSVTFSVTGVSLAGYTYNDGDNHVSSIDVP